MSHQSYPPESSWSHPSSGHHLPTPPPAHFFPVVARSRQAESHYATLSAYDPTVMNSLAGYHPVYPFPPSMPMHAPLPSQSVLQPQHWANQNYSFNGPTHRVQATNPHPPPLASSAPLPQPSTHFATTQFPQSVYTAFDSHHCLANPSPILRLGNPLSNSQFEPSDSLHQPEGSTIQDQLAQQPQRPQPSYHTNFQGSGMFSGAHNLSLTDNTFIDNSNTSDDFMEKFLQQTIVGAEFDSSDRDPPPRCHPGTRLAIIDRCRSFIAECDGEEKMRWVVGPAGAGKSAIMQVVAEEAPADASVFFSVNGRRDGTKTFTTIAYQLATKYEPYRQFIRNEIMRDPSLLQKLLPAQFQKFIVDPFIHQHLFDHSSRVVFVIDGLDECNSPAAQRTLLTLISNFCLSFPTSPIVWFVASRPEPHITSFFEDDRVWPAYTKEEIIVDSDEACEDVQRYLRAELNNIKFTHPNLRRKREWPSELEFTKIATAAGGLFAYVSTVVQFIGDPYYGDPGALIRLVLDAINASPKDHVLGRAHPMAQLDALYARILSTIPADVMSITRKLLLVSLKGIWSEENFRSQCNRLEITEDAAYGSLSHLHAVLKVPAPYEADDEHLEYFHKSFVDFLLDFRRSGFCHSITDEAEKLQAESAMRVAKQVMDNFSGAVNDESVKCSHYGYLKSSTGFCDNVSLSWPSDERSATTNDQLKLNLYCASIGEISHKFKFHRKFYRAVSFFRLLTSSFLVPGFDFPFYELRASAFRDFRAELTELGELTQVPLRSLNYAAVCGRIDLHFTRYTGEDAVCSDPWNPSCKHQRYAKAAVDGLEPSWSWATTFERFINGPEDHMAHTDIPQFGVKAGKPCHWDSVDRGGLYECLNCSQRFAHHFVNNPDQLATVFVDSTDMCYVELSLVDPEDGVSKWRYRFFHSGLYVMC